MTIRSCTTESQTKLTKQHAVMSPSIATRENREFASEIKFLVTPTVGKQICSWARRFLSADPYAGGEVGDQYRITSLYFDTRKFDVFHRRGSFGRSKYRIRRYGDSDIVFLERKLKAKGLLSKRRSTIGIGELPRLSEGPQNSGWAGAWFQRRLEARQLDPICQISYRRTARVAMTPLGPIRLTVDQDLRAEPVTSVAFTGQPGREILPNKVVLEMKFLVAMPALFKGIVSEFALTPIAFSKYRQAAQELGLVGEDEEEALRTIPLHVYA